MFTFSPSVRGKEGAHTYFPLTPLPAESPCWDHITFLRLISESLFCAVQETAAPVAFTAVAKAAKRTPWSVLRPCKLNKQNTESKEMRGLVDCLFVATMLLEINLILLEILFIPLLDSAPRVQNMHLIGPLAGHSIISISILEAVTDENGSVGSERCHPGDWSLVSVGCNPTECQAGRHRVPSLE